MNPEAREWLGLTRADLLVYLGAAAIFAMFLVKDPRLSAALAVVGVVLALVACPLGMKRDPKVSRITNLVKLVSYPGCVLMAIGAILVRYAQS